MLDKNPLAQKFLDQVNPTFRDIHHACDSVYRNLRQQGVGTQVRHAEVITADEENVLWSSGVIGTDTPVSLQRAVFYYVGKRFCIRGGEEQRRLGPSQFHRSYNPDCYTYVEHGSKNRSGGLKQLSLENKSVPCPAVTESIPRCFVYLFDKYLSKLPPFAFEKDILYLRAKDKVPCNEKDSWYICAPIGRNKLSSMLKEMCVDAGIKERSNHSLRATGITSLFQADVHEKVIQKTSGHRSLEALRSYEKISTEQHQKVSQLLVSGASPQYSTITTTANDTRMCGGFYSCSISNMTINVNPVYDLRKN